MHHVTHRQLDDLAGFGAGNIRDLDHLGRHMARRGVLANLRLDFADQFLIQGQAIAQPNEQDDAHVIVPILADDDTLDDFRQFLDLTIDLGGTNAHTAGIEYGVRATKDDDAVMLGQFDVIAVMPDIRIALEIGGLVALVVRVIPEADRHAGERPDADQFAFLAGDGLARVVPDFDRHAETARLDLTAPNRNRGIAEHEAGNDIGAAGDRGAADILLHLLL